MMGRRTLGAALLAALPAALATGPAAAQGLAARVARSPDGLVHFTFAARPGVCGDGCDIVTRDGDGCGCGLGRSANRRAEGTEVTSDCEPGPVRVSLTVRGGTVASLRTYVGGRWATGAAAGAPGAVVTDLGAVAAREAADFLLNLARRDDGRAGEEAIFAATLADSVSVWPTLLELARDARVAQRTRRRAVFWLGQAAGAAVTRELAGLVAEPDLDGDVKAAAVFALSQRPREEGVPALITIARTHPDAALRRKALFWLSQTDDPRALALFEELLTRP